jgi:cytidine deaminase
VIKENLDNTTLQLINKLVDQVLALPRDFDITELDEKYIWDTLAVAWLRPACDMSGFKVGTTIISRGRPYYGVNNEDPTWNVCCGERSAMWGAQAYAGQTGTETKIDISYVFCINPISKEVEVGISSSCGLCRQAYAMHGGNTTPVIYAHHGKLWKRKASELLPDPYVFLPKNLVPRGVPIKALKKPKDHVDAILQLPREGGFEVTTEIEGLIYAAVIAAQASYAPYYPLREGAALLVESPDFEGGKRIFDMGIIQNASFGVTQAEVQAVYANAIYEVNKARLYKPQNVAPVYKMMVVIGLNALEELVPGVAISGGGRQAGSEVPGGMNTKFIYVNKESKLVCVNLDSLLVDPFTFIEIVRADNLRN